MDVVAKCIHVSTVCYRLQGNYMKAVYIQTCFSKADRQLNWLSYWIQHYVQRSEVIELWGHAKKKRSYLIVAFVNAIQIETNMITNEQLRGINYVRNWSIQSSENNNQRDMNTHLRNVSCWVCYCIQPSCMPITAPVFFLFPSQSDSIDTGLVFNTKWNTNRIHSKKRMKWNGNGNKKTNRLVKERKKKRKGKEMKWNKWVILPDRALDPLWLNWGNISGTRFSSVIGLLDRYMQSHITDLKYWRNL